MKPTSIALFYILLLSFLLLFPFQFYNPISFLENNIEWLFGKNGIKLSKAGVLRKDSPNRFYEGLMSGEGLSLEVWLSTKNTEQSGLHDIISYSSNKYTRNFTLAQKGDRLQFRLRTSETKKDGVKKRPHFEINEVFLKNKVQHIVATYNFDRKIVYVEGKQIAQTLYPGGNFSNWDPSYSLMIGNEQTGNYPWRGEIYFVAMYNRALSAKEVQMHYFAGSQFDSLQALEQERVSNGLIALYPLSDARGRLARDIRNTEHPTDLHMPELLKVSSKVLLRPPYQNFSLDFGTIKDFVVNVLAFIPLGFFAYYFLQGRSLSIVVCIGMVLIAGASFSFIVELLQYFIRSRSSSLTDVINNTLGVGLGILVHPFFKNGSYFKK